MYERCFFCIKINGYTHFHYYNIANETFVYQRFHAIFSRKWSIKGSEELFTNCTLEYTLAMLDTNLREVNMENIEIEIPRKERVSKSGLMGEREK
jgi:hypothetical protein